MGADIVVGAVADGVAISLRSVSVVSTIKDYLRWRGDITFTVAPFNIIDNIVLAALAYVDLGGTGADGERGVILSDAFASVLSAGDDITPYLRSMAAVDTELLALAGDSARFGGARLHDYVDEIDDGEAMQFSALTADLLPNLSAVVFRGTDHSLVGWREDFLLGCKVTQAQARAASYLERMTSRAADEGRRVVVCGHSKGGSLAAYAACLLPVSLRRHVVHVWSDDGPNMAPEAAPCDVVATLGELYSHVVPAYSIVGMLFVPADDPCIIVRSGASGFLQHDPTTWEVCATDVVRADGLSPESRMVAETFTAWLDGVDLPTRERFVGELFDALAAGNPDRIDAVLSSPAAVRRVIVATSGMSASTKGVARKLFSVAAASVANIATTVAGRAVNDAATAVRSLAVGALGSPDASVRKRAADDS